MEYGIANLSYDLVYLCGFVVFLAILYIMWLTTRVTYRPSTQLRSYIVDFVNSQPPGTGPRDMLELLTTINDQGELDIGPRPAANPEVRNESSNVNSEPGPSERRSNEENVETESDMSFKGRKVSVEHADCKNDEIEIRLKYMNDDLRVVKAVLNETLKKFKRKNFTSEMSARKTVRLIFNGRVLKNEDYTLRALGLTNNCVVHCLVIGPKSETNVNQIQSLPVAENPFSLLDMNLSMFLSIFTGVGLAMVWFFKFYSPAFFSFPSNFSLVLLSVIYLTSLFCAFLMETVPVA